MVGLADSPTTTPFSVTVAPPLSTTKPVIFALLNPISEGFGVSVVTFGLVDAGVKVISGVP